MVGSPDRDTRSAARGENAIWENPIGTDGFEFVEYTAEDPALLAVQFESLGFEAVARHRSKSVTLYRQGDVSFLVNAEPDSFSQQFARLHGPSVCAVAFRVRDAAQAYAAVLERGAEPFVGPVGPMELNIPAIKGIGDSVIYLVDRYGQRSIYDVDFVFDEDAVQRSSTVGLTHIDHLTNNVHQGNMDTWASFYERLFNFKQIRYFNIEGQVTGLRSRAMTSPCGKIRIPINESADDQSQIMEYLRAYNGEGVQHVALGTDDIYSTVRALRERGVRLLETPAAYYEAVAARLPGHGEDLAQLRELNILVDGQSTAADAVGADSRDKHARLLLQIFTENMIGPIFFEVIQRKGDEGFGEGNFQALFEAIERDQIARGVVAA